jgi:hypothetical protein
MVGPLDYVFLVVSLSAEVYVAALSVIRKDFLRYPTLLVYMFAAALVTAGGIAVWRIFGFTSPQYQYFYCYSDCVLTVCLYLAVTGLYLQAFQEMGVVRYIRVATLLLLVGTALFSYIVIQRNTSHLTTRFVVELGQNLYFVGLILTYMLWLAVLRLRETRTRLIQLVLSLGIYFSATAAAFALRNMFPAPQFVKLVQPLAGTFLPVAWAYTFTRIPEGARLATAQVASPHR